MTENTTPAVYTNARIKSYPGKAVVQVASKPIFQYTPGLSQPRGYDVSPPGMAEDPDRAKEESQRRAAARVKGYLPSATSSSIFSPGRWTAH